jgi:ribosomal protein S18 acetylase RimI-like enzyme
MRLDGDIEERKCRDMLTLRPMTELEYERYLQYLHEDYAQERSKSLGTPIEEEREFAVRQIGELLRDGLSTEGHSLWMLVDDAGTAVGHLWAFLDAKTQRAFIYDIVVDEPYRGKGYGAAALAILEREMKARGATRISLNVFGQNVVAMHLYQKMGYSTAATLMQKDI